MNHSVTSKEAILRNCRQLVSEQGLSSLNMRLVAKSCKVALGSLYYYFPSKNDLLIATIESVWEDIFYLKDTSVSHSCFTEYIDQIFNNIQSGIQKYPNFLQYILWVFQVRLKPGHKIQWSTILLKSNNQCRHPCMLMNKLRRLLFQTNLQKMILSTLYCQI